MDMSTGLKDACGFVAVSVLLGGPATAASASQPAAPPPIAAQRTDDPSQLDELDAVIVNGQKPSRKPSEILTWMRRLTGQYRYEGHIDLLGNGDPDDMQPVTGSGDCIGFGPAPAVQCEINVRWPETPLRSGEVMLGAVSNLSPAMILFGFEPDERGIRFMLVDNKGIAEPALGLLAGDTLTSTERCVNTPGVCQKTTRITAEPEGKLIEMQIDVETSYRLTTSYRFVLHRVSDLQAERAPKARQ
jgi:hypothetical protein